MRGGAESTPDSANDIVMVSGPLPTEETNISYSFNSYQRMIHMG